MRLHPSLLALFLIVATPAFATSDAGVDALPDAGFCQTVTLQSCQMQYGVDNPCLSVKGPTCAEYCDLSCEGSGSSADAGVGGKQDPGGSCSVGGAGGWLLCVLAIVLLPRRSASRRDRQRPRPRRGAPALLLWLSLTCACVGVYGDPSQHESAGSGSSSCGPTPIPGHEYRDPQTGICTYYNDSVCAEQCEGCVAPITVGVEMTNSYCQGPCEGLDEAGCVSTQDCHVAISSAGFVACWTIAPWKSIGTNDCPSLGVDDCAESDTCASVMQIFGNGGAQFIACAPPPAM